MRTFLLGDNIADGKIAMEIAVDVIAPLVPSLGGSDAGRGPTGAGPANPDARLYIEAPPYGREEQAQIDDADAGAKSLISALVATGTIQPTKYAVPAGFSKNANGIPVPPPDSPMPAWQPPVPSSTAVKP